MLYPHNMTCFWSILGLTRMFIFEDIMKHQILSDDSWASGTMKQKRDHSLSQIKSKSTTNKNRTAKSMNLFIYFNHLVSLSLPRPRTRTRTSRTRTRTSYSVSCFNFSSKFLWNQKSNPRNRSTKMI